MSSLSGRLRAWLALSRLPFHTVGIVPFVLGTVLAWRRAGTFRWDVFVLGTLGVTFVMLATYYAGEYWDVVEDGLASQHGVSRFAGGSQVVQRGLLPHRAPLWGSLVSLLVALGVSVLLQFVFRTGPWTVPYALMGLLGGFFYSAQPVRWVSTGIGELWIAFCYGWLPVAVGYYLQVGVITPVVHWLAAPIGLTIFNVILLNEFPDHAADRQAGKKNLAVRLGLDRAAVLYVLISVAGWATFLLSLRSVVPWLAFWLYLPVMALSVGLTVLMLRGRWRNRQALEMLCGANLIVNLGTTLSYVLALVIWV